MKWYYVPLALAAAVLAGCPDEDRHDYYMQRYMSSVRVIASMELQAKALPAGDPQRALIEQQLAVHRNSLDRFLAKLLEGGLRVETDDYVLTATYSDSRDVKTHVAVTVPEPAERQLQEVVRGLQMELDAAENAADTLRSQVLQVNTENQRLHEVLVEERAASTHPEARK